MQLVRFRKALSILLLFMTLGSESEQTEVNRLPAGNREKRPKRTKSNILSRFQEEQRSTVEALLDATGICLEEKMNFFKMIIVEDANLFLDVFFYLKDKKKAESPEEAEYNFLKLMSENKRIMMSKLVNDESNLLEKLIAREKEDVKQAFEKWKLAGKPMSILMILNPPQVCQHSTSIKSEPQKSESSEKSEPSRTLSTYSEDSPLIQTDVTENSENCKNDDKPPQIDTSFLKNLPKYLTILVMGETGSGKSTFINAIVNYLKYSSISEAEQKGIEILIKTAFTHVHLTTEVVRIECEPTIEVECQGEPDYDEEEVTVAGESSTQSPKSYLFTFGPKGNKRRIRIIDTPGVGDVRGVAQEKKNFDKILRFITKFKNIHAICILLKASVNRHTVTYRYCINELLAHLHASASKNIIFCFTHTRASFYKPGDALTTLKAHLEKLKMEKNVAIPLTRETVFCFDNESFRFLCTHSKGSFFSQKEVNDFNISWNKSVVETFRLFKQISELEPHNVAETLSVNNIRRTLFALVRPMAEIARLQLVNDKLIREKQEEVENYTQHRIELKGRLTVPQEVIIPKELDYPMTVCTGKDCVKYQKFSDHPKAQLEAIYEPKCHRKCYLQGVKPETFPNTDIQKCYAMAKDINKCRVCGCPWMTHLHIRYDLTREMEEKVDPIVQRSIDNNDDKRKQAEIFLQTLKKTRDEKQKEADFITKACASFAAFLKKNLIIPYNDAFAEYIELLINEERGKVNKGENGLILNQLTEYRDVYQQHVTLLDAHTNENISGLKIENVQKMIDDLKTLKHNGKLLTDVENIELLSVQQQLKEERKQGKTVNLNSGWMGEVDLGPSGSMTKLMSRGTKAMKNGLKKGKQVAKKAQNSLHM